MVFMQSISRGTHKKLLELAPVRFMVGLAAFAASAAIFGLLSLNLFIKHGEKVAVPNVVNKSVVEALDILSERGLELRKTGARNSSVIPENYILSQDPLPGTVVKEGRPISVVISLGSKVSTVPNLAGKSLREARVELNGAGLKVGRFAKMHHLSEADTVLAQSPTPNQQVDRETPVDILLSLGPRPRDFKTPNLVGLPLDKASKILDVMGVTVGDVTSKINLSHAPGIILEQDPLPGSLVAEGSSVSLVVSALTADGEKADRKLTLLLYRVPYGFWEKKVRIEVTDPDGTRTVYDEMDQPGSTINLAIGYTAQCTIRIYVDGVLETERTVR
jgi:serine/threonine-protein kinase